MNKDLDIQIAEALNPYLASGVLDQVYYQKFYFYSIVTHSTAYPENDTVNSQLDTVNGTVNSQIMEFFNISESTAKRATRGLKKLGYIEREGSDKTGRWFILK